MNAVSLFASSGIGDLGLRANGISTVIASELLSERAALFQHNYPETKDFNEDIWKCKDDIVSYYQDHFGAEELFLILATPPARACRQMAWGKYSMTTGRDCVQNLMRETG